MSPHGKVVQDAQLERFAQSKRDFQSWLLEKQDGRSSLFPAWGLTFLIFEPPRKNELARYKIFLRIPHPIVQVQI